MVERKEKKQALRLTQRLFRNVRKVNLKMTGEAWTSPVMG
jgi:hypothetical protein